MKKYILSIIFLSVVSFVTAQKSQRIGYIDMQYILQNIPQYLQAQNSLNSKVEKWKTELAKETSAIESLKTDLANEKAILTKELIAEREEDITVKETALRNLKNLYFGAEGKLYTTRKQLVQPIQDQVYNSVQTIAKRKKLDFVFDKSSDLVMLYSNSKHDISELVVKLINVDQKRQAKQDKIAARKQILSRDALSDEDKAKLAKKEEINKTRQEAKEDKKKRIAEKRKAQLKAREAKRAALLRKRDSLRKARLELKNKR